MPVGVMPMGVMPRMMSGVVAADVAPCAMVRPCGSGSGNHGDGSRTQRQRKDTKRPAERKQLKHL
jgi:hypothetical protein